MFPLIYAHRGASLYAPENTMPAFNKAIELGADGIELDVQLSRDGQVVVIHDELLSRTTNLTGFVKDYDYNVLKTCDAGSWFNKEYFGIGIPLLSDVLEIVSGSNTLLNIEIKTGVVLYPSIEQKVIDLVHRFGMAERTILSSFNHYTLLECKKVADNIEIAPLYVGGFVAPWDYAKKIGAKYIHPIYFNMINADDEQRKELKSSGIKVNVFTPDKPQEWKALIHYEVNGIITNDAGGLVSLKNSMRGR